MNRLTLMQTQSPVPIQYFNSQTTLVAQNSPNYADHEATSYPGASLANDRKCLMLVTIKADCVADLRHLVMRTCGELIVFIRTQPIAHATKMKVWLCLSSTATDMVMDAIMRSLPSVEFGQITHR